MRIIILLATLSVVAFSTEYPELIGESEIQLPTKTRPKNIPELLKPFISLPDSFDARKEWPGCSFQLDDTGHDSTKAI